jgi:autoinducer 2 (AI-2) kinase
VCQNARVTGPRRYLLGLDVGGGGGRAVLVDAETGETRSAFRGWSPEGESDVDLEAVWRALAAACREVLANATPDSVAAVAVTSMRLGSVLLDATGAALHAGWNRDLRAIPHGLALAARCGPELAAAVGRWPIPNCLAARLHWLGERAPERLAAARSALSLGDWVAFRLCGERATDFSHAAETSLVDARTRDWAWDWIERLGLPREIFPPIRAAGTWLGKLGGPAARDLGLARGIAVALGGGDTQCGLVGCGALSDGDLAIVAGTTAPLQQVLTQSCVDPEARLWTGLHAARGRWVLESNAGPVGEALDWLAHVLYPDAAAPAAELLHQAGLQPPGAGGALSTFGASVFDARALRPSYGCLALPSLGVARGAASRALLARAAVEGIAWSIRANLEQLEKLSARSPESIRLCGGLARSAAFAQVLADALEQPVHAARVVESSGLGAALCAGVGAGVFRDLDEAARALGSSLARFDPDPARARALAERRPAWERLRMAQPDAAALMGLG